MDPVARILVKAGLLSEQQCDQLQEYQRTAGSKSTSVSVVELGWIPEHILLDCLSQNYGVPKINLRVVQIEPSILQLVPAEICRRHLLIPVKRMGPTIVLAMANPADKAALENVRFVIQSEISVVVATELMIREALEQYFGAQELQGVLNEVFTDDHEFAGFQESGPTVQKPIPNICPSCRSIVQPNHRFCSGCGAILSSFDNPVIPPPIFQTEPPKKREPSAQISPTRAAIVNPPTPSPVESDVEFSPTVTVEAYSPSIEHTLLANTIPDPPPVTVEPPPHPLAPLPMEPVVSILPPVEKTPRPRPKREPATQEDAWKRLSVFVSSTLADMNAERNYLATQIFPKLRQELLEQKIQFMDFDPRMSVHPVSIRQSMERISTSTAFIGILGERYGNILEFLPEEVVRTHPWLLRHSGASQAALEITQGLRKREKIKTYFYFRKPDFFNEMPENARADFLIEDPWRSAKLSMLKQQIRDTTGAREYSCRWNEESGIIGLEEFGNDVYGQLRDLAQEIASQNAKYAARDSNIGDEVECTVLAPSSVFPGRKFTIEASLDFQDDVQESGPDGIPADQQRRFKSLPMNIVRGENIAFELSLGALEIRQSTQSLQWAGKPASVAFEVTVPDQTQAGMIEGKLMIYQSSLPVGRIRFRINVTEPTVEELEREPVGEDARLYRMAFVSYASEDRAKVLERIPALETLGIRYFEDILRLEPGDRWNKKLYTYIDYCDLFLLFWSHAASESEWVRKEVNHALQRNADSQWMPEIHPIVVDASQSTQPWPELAHIPLNRSL